MADAYSITHQTAAGTQLGIINLTGSTTLSLCLFSIQIGLDDNADESVDLVLNLSNGTGTGTDLAEVPLDPLATASTCAARGGVFSSAPSQVSYSSRLNIAMYQKASFRWQAANRHSCILSSAILNNGLYLRCRESTATPNINATMMWRE